MVIVGVEAIRSESADETGWLASGMVGREADVLQENIHLRARPASTPGPPDGRTARSIRDLPATAPSRGSAHEASAGAAASAHQQDRQNGVFP